MTCSEASDGGIEPSNGLEYSLRSALAALHIYVNSDSDLSDTKPPKIHPVPTIFPTHRKPDLITTFRDTPVHAKNLETKSFYMHTSGIENSLIGAECTLKK